MISSSFIRLDLVPAIGYILSLFSHGTNEAYIQSISLEYKSMIRNIMRLTISFLGIILLHVAIDVPLQLYASRFNEESKFRKLSKMLFLFLPLQFTSE
jgi:hypothetical protein